MKNQKKTDLWWSEKMLRMDTLPRWSAKPNARTGATDKSVWILTFLITASVPIVGLCLKAAVGLGGVRAEVELSHRAD